MEQIIKYKTSDELEWYNRDAAEEHEKYLNIVNQIKEHKVQIDNLTNVVENFQKNCPHTELYDVVERESSRSVDDGSWSGRYGVPVLESHYKCKICDKKWVRKRDL